MEYRRLGKAGVQVSALSFGTWLTFGKQIDDTTADSLLSLAYEHGINFFDSAEAYAGGKAEEVLGKILKSKSWGRGSYLVSGKVFFGAEPKGINLVGLSRKHVIECCHAALKRMQVEYLDFYFCHRPDKKTPIEETVLAMNTLIQQGKILYWGTSEWSGVEIAIAHEISSRYGIIGPSMEQPQYNMLERHKIENEFLMLFQQYGMGTTIWSPLASGLLSGKYLDADPKDTRLHISGLEWLKNRTLAEENLEKVKKIKKVADQLGVSMAKLALAWCLKNPNVSTVILGATKMGQLQENLGAIDILAQLSPSIMEELEVILANKPKLPEY
jgi:voltage-dependent potassium channel beta subunit